MILARACAAAFLTACTWVTGPASAQTYPDHPVTLLVAFPPGGADDAIARMIQDPMQKALGEPSGYMRLNAQQAANTSAANISTPAMVS